MHIYKNKKNRGLDCSLYWSWERKLSWWFWAPQCHGQEIISHILENVVDNSRMPGKSSGGSKSSRWGAHLAHVPGGTWSSALTIEQASLGSCRANDTTNEPSAALRSHPTSLGISWIAIFKDSHSKSYHGGLHCSFFQKTLFIPVVLYLHKFGKF